MMLLALLPILVISFGLCLVLTRVVRALAPRWGLVDRPDGRRKLHGRAIPVAGGLAIHFSAAATLALLLLLSEPVRQWCLQQGQKLLGLSLGAAIICTVGVLDDLGLLRGRHKLLGQLLAVSVVMCFGVVVRFVHLFGWEIDLGLLSVPFTMFLLLGAVNSLNLLDGMDGLLTSVGLILCLAMAAMAIGGEHWAAACVAVALAGALLGFLPYNFPPATIFLGDCGSMLIGLVIGVLAIQTSLKAPATVALAAPTALLTVPIFDTLAAIVRRKLTGRSIYNTDRDHLHHCLLRRGWSNSRALLVVACFCLITVAGVFASLVFKNELLAVVSGLAVVGILVSCRVFGHAEASLLLSRLRGVVGSFGHGRPDPEGRGSAVRLHGSADWNEAWVQIVNRGPEFGLVMVRLDVNAPALGEGYHARWDGPVHESEEAAVWRAEVPLAAQGRCIGRLEVAGRHDGEPAWRKMAALAGLVQNVEATVTNLADGARRRTGPATNGRHAKAENGAVQEAARPDRHPPVVGAPALNIVAVRQDATAR
jgi:UDP-GlcNAc:undecaprenyl-phosphate GlcNAc-1-phosphate transferase